MDKQFDGTDADSLQEDARLEGFATDQELAHEDPRDLALHPPAMWWADYECGCSGPATNRKSDMPKYCGVHGQRMSSYHHGLPPDSMKTSPPHTLLNSIPREHHAALAAAHDRYMYFTGVYTDTNPDFSAERIAEDRTRFAHLLAFTGDGRPWLSDERCAEFMSAITGLPRDWRIAWDEMEFIETHGEDFFEKQLRRQESERLAAQYEGAPA